MIAYPEMGVVMGGMIKWEDGNFGDGGDDGI